MAITVTYLTVPQLRPLIEPEVVGVNKYTHYMEIKSSDIPAGLAAAAPWTVFFGSFYKYNRVNGVALIVQQGFENTADAAFNSVLVDVGDAGDPDGYITVAQCAAKAGALIKVAYKTGAYTVPKDYAADTVLQFTLTPGAGKSLSNLKRGSVIVLFDLFKFPPPIDTDSV